MARDQEMIPVTAEFRFEREASYAVWEGGYEDDPRNPGQQREKLIFLPKSKCEKGEGKNEWLVPL